VVQRERWATHNDEKRAQFLVRFLAVTSHTPHITRLARMRVGDGIWMCGYCVQITCKEVSTIAQITPARECRWRGGGHSPHDESFWRRLQKSPFVK
jgi:hypothetical protein